MAKNLHPPEKLLLTGNLKENYRKFKQQFQIYLTAAGISNSKEGDVKICSISCKSITFSSAIFDYSLSDTCSSC